MSDKLKEQEQQMRQLADENEALKIHAQSLGSLYGDIKGNKANPNKNSQNYNSGASGSTKGNEVQAQKANMISALQQKLLIQIHN